MKMPAFNDPDDNNILKYAKYLPRYLHWKCFIHTFMCSYRIQVWKVQSVITYSSLNIKLHEWDFLISCDLP
jgi:hypothetical protein